MAALPVSIRYSQPNISKIHFLPAIAAYPAACTSSEVTAGTDLTGEVADISGFSSKADFIETPDLANAFVPKIAGRIKADDSSLTFYADKTGADVRNVLTQGLAGFLVFMDGGATTGNKMDQFAVTVASVSTQRNVAGTEVVRIMVDFAQTRVPATHLAVP